MAPSCLNLEWVSRSVVLAELSRTHAPIFLFLYSDGVVESSNAFAARTDPMVDSVGGSVTLDYN